jgi:hypothetical protein
LLSIFVIALLITPAISLHSIGLASGQSSDVYHNEKYGFSIQPPSGWIVVEPGLAGTIVQFLGPIEDNHVVSFNIVTEDALGLALNEYVYASKQNMAQNFTNFELLSEGSRTIGGRDAYEIVYTFTMGVKDLKAKVVLLLKDSRAYVITYGGFQDNYDGYLPAFESSIESFKLESKPPINWDLIGNVLIIIGVIIVVIGIAAAVYMRRHKPR